MVPHGKKDNDALMMMMMIIIMIKIMISSQC